VRVSLSASSVAAHLILERSTADRQLRSTTAPVAVLAGYADGG